MEGIGSSLNFNQIERSNMTHEEFRHCIYDQFKCGGGFKNSQVRCYEILNEKRTTQPTNRRYSQYEHYYKIRW